MHIRSFDLHTLMGTSFVLTLFFNEHAAFFFKDLKWLELTIGGAAYTDLRWNKVEINGWNRQTDRPAGTNDMWLREELLKSIWHAFRALDLDQRGKVSKSQLKVRSKTSISKDLTASEKHVQLVNTRLTKYYIYIINSHNINVFKTLNIFRLKIKSNWYQFNFHFAASNYSVVWILDVIFKTAILNYNRTAENIVLMLHTFDNSKRLMLSLIIYIFIYRYIWS